jgi:hypothetical protein
MQTDSSECLSTRSYLHRLPTYREDSFQKYRPRDNSSTTKRNFMIYLAADHDTTFHYTVVNDDSSLVLGEIERAARRNYSKKRDRPDSYKYPRGDKKTREEGD